MKNLYDISWQVSEPDYRADDALSYSTLAKYERSGFNGLSTLFDKVESSSLTFGSAVDAIITGGEQEFNEHFMVADFPTVKSSVRAIVTSLFNDCKDKYIKLIDIPASIIVEYTEINAFQLNWKPETRAKVIKEQGSEFYSLLFAAGDKTILDQATYNDVMNAVDALRTSTATSRFFAPNTTSTYVREYQLKFKTTLDNINYRCMADLLITDHKERVVYPIDLKTSGHPEWDFYESFVTWNYDIQARLYWRIIRKIMDEDPYFKDFRLADYQFIVVNRNTLTPLVWSYGETWYKGTLIFGKNNEIVFRDPTEIGKELNYYLSSRPEVPLQINKDYSNSIRSWLNKDVKYD